MSQPQVDSSDLSEAERFVRSGIFDQLLDGMSDGEAAELLYRWSFWRRPDQSVPSTMGTTHDVLLVRAGRGFGKTRMGAETVRQMVETHSPIALVGSTAADVRDTMVEGESGIMRVFPPGQLPKYEPSKRRVTFHNGARATTFSADEPERLRGPEHAFGWLDEPASYRFGADAWDNFSLGLRVGKTPWTLLTGTPKRKPWLRAVSQEATTIERTGSSYRNIANLAPKFIQRVIARYEGTRLGRQEVHAEWLDDVVGALWRMSDLDNSRFDKFDVDDKPWQQLTTRLLEQKLAVPIEQRRAWRTIVAVDPPGETAECGIVVAAAPTKGSAGVDHCVVLEDCSMSGSPEEWGSAVVEAVRKWHAQAAFVEKNQGGDMVRSTIHAVDRDVLVKKINATQSKAARAEPIAALYEKGYVHHVGFFPQLEEQMTTWVPKEYGGDSKSPDRLDALVHAVRELLPDRPVSRGRLGSAVGRSL